MMLVELIEFIEGIEFNIKFSVLSGFTTVLSALEYEETVAELMQAITDKPDQQRAILYRIEALIPEYKSGYMHPYDIAITAYLFALNRVNSYGYLETVTDKIVALEEFWWARRLAQIVRQSLTKSQAIETSYEPHVVFEDYSVNTFSPSENKIPA